MPLIINETALADFAAESVNVSSTTMLFSKVISSLEYVNTLNVDHSGAQDPSIPDTLTAGAIALWNADYAARLTFLQNYNLEKAYLDVYAFVVSLFNLTQTAPNSRANVILQLTATFAQYSFTKGQDFLTALTA